MHDDKVNMQKNKTKFQQSQYKAAAFSKKNCLKHTIDIIDKNHISIIREKGEF